MTTEHGVKIRYGIAEKIGFVASALGILATLGGMISVSYKIGTWTDHVDNAINEIPEIANTQQEILSRLPESTMQQLYSLIPLILVGMCSFIYHSRG